MPRPNVIVIITDDQGYGDLGCHGNPFADTPNLDALHDESVRLVDFHAAPMCTPTRGQLLTGLDAARNGAINVSSGRTLLRADLPTLADAFRADGYRTGIFGKWHLGDNYPYRPQDRGFEESLWFPSSHISSVPDFWENDYFDDVYMHNGTRERQEGYCTQVFFDAAREWMDQRFAAEEPFLAFLPTNAPHYPHFVPAEDREAIEAIFASRADQLPELNAELRTALIRFLAMIRNLDREVGDLRAFLRQRDQERDTLLVFMTDNGSTFGPVYFNAGMRGKKTELWEGGHRVPCFIRWPGGGLEGPREVDGLTQVQDLMPTLCSLAGVPPLPSSTDGTAVESPAAHQHPTPDGQAAAPPMDGIDLSDILAGNSHVTEDRILVINYSRMPGDLDYPTPDSPSHMIREGAAVLWKRWRLIAGSELYDLDADPGQTNDVRAAHPDVMARLQDHLDGWWEEVEPVANKAQHIIVGSDHENPMMLTACEWMDVFVDQQKQIRRAARKNSYWHLDVERPGSYEFELRRWPRESGLALRQASPAAQLTDGFLDEGVALPIARARIMIGGSRLNTEVASGDEGAVFVIDLEPRPTLLHTWFDDADGKPLCGAYYVYARRVGV